jgi:prepilin-type N-terminal cleavage/methylation domain-containing protein
MRTKFQKAFTLIELLIVVAIIAILAAIAVPNFLEAQVRSKVSRAKADMRSTATALEAYAVDNNRYPDVQTPTGAIPIKLGIPYSRACLVKLSTPIGYLTTGLLTDVFAIGSQSTTFFGYANMKPAVDSGDIDLATGGAATTQQKSMLLEHLWILQSVGPDRVNFALSPPPAGFAAAVNALTTKTNMDFYYDPTNGTVSGGDVVRSGKGQL